MDDPQHQPAFEAPSIEELVPLFPAYDLGGFVAQGGMGAVYHARQKSLDRPVAIKILPREFGSDAQFRRSFEAEAKAMAKLNHPNLISVYDFGDIDGMLFIVMEFVEGKSVHHSAHGIAIEQKEAAHVVSGICRGLAHAHQNGILHRDIKPANILLTKKAQPKIGDFGLARPVAHDHNPDEIIFGTPGYTAPEVLHNPHAVDQRTDIYAVGIILYELLTGQLPGDPWQPPSAIARTNIGFDAIVRRATHPSPELRYTDPNELADELDALTKKLDSGVLRQNSLVTPGGVTAPSPTTTSSIARPSLASAQKSSFPVWAVILLLTGIAGVFGYIAITGGDPAKPTPAVQKPAPAPEPKPKPKPNRKPKPKPVVDRNPNKPDKPKPKPPAPVDPAPVPTETPADALARLQSKLRSGDLSEMPPGTATHNDTRYFLVEEALNWTDAARFAEDHGGQLAILPSPADLEWAAEQFKATSSLWVGLSDSGTENAWHWLDGSKPDQSLWAPNQPDNTTSKEDGEDFAVLLPGVNQLDDLPASLKLPFLIQWDPKGTNTGTFSRQLSRTGAALKARRGPIFPAGTRNIGGSRFLLLAQSGTWDQASAAATAAGGHLAVPSSTAEAAWITDTLRATLGPAQACWIGGRKSPAAPRWEFVTAEKFEFIAWAAEQPADGQRLQVIRSGGESGGFGYQTADTDDLARYLLIEWSAPSHRNMPDESEAAMPDRASEWLAAYRQQTYDRNKVKYERFLRRWNGNIEDFIDEVNSEIDTAKKIELRMLEKFAKDYLKTVRENGRIPKDVPAGTPRSVREIHEKSLAEQKEIWAEFKEDFEGIYNKYLEDVLDQAEKLDRNGDDEGADLILREHAATEDDEERMHAILRGEFPPVPDPPKEQADKDQETGEDK